MAKHFGKVVLFAAAAGAAAAGLYYYLTQRDTEFDDDFDDFDDFEDFDADDDGKAGTKSRHYVNLDTDSDENPDDKNPGTAEADEKNSGTAETDEDLDEEDPKEGEADEPVPDKTEEFYNDADDDIDDLKKLDGAV